MKKINLIFSLLLIAGSLLSQELFLDRYAKIRDTAEDDSFQVSRMNEKELKKAIKSSENKEDAKIMKKAKTVLMGFDLSDDQPGKEDFEALTKQYEELMSFNVEAFKVLILSKTTNNKIKELIIIMNMGKEANIIGNIGFKKAIAMDDWMDLTGGIKFNNTSLSDMMNGSIPNMEFTMDDVLENNSIVEVDKKEGVKSKKTGKIIIPAEYDNISIFDELAGIEYFHLTKGDYQGLADKTGKIIISPEYDNISTFDELSGIEYILLSKGDYQGLADKTGKIIIPVEYDEISEFDVPGYFKVTKNDQVGLINKAGKVIVKPKYEELNVQGENQVELKNEKGKISIFGLKIKK